MAATPKRQLATLLFRGDLEEFVRAKRDAGVAWRLVARELYEATDGQVDITHETLRVWFPDPEPTEATA